VKSLSAYEFRSSALHDGVVDRFLSLAPLFGGGFGAGSVGLIGVAVVLMLAIMLLPSGPSRLLVTAIEAVPPIVWVVLCLGGPLLMGTVFVRRRLRAIRDRRFVIVDGGVMSCTARRGCEALRWSDIESIEETIDRREEAPTFVLTIRGHGRRLTVGQAEIEGYARIRQLVHAQVAARMTLHPAYDR
jgi:hypothetical protein